MYRPVSLDISLWTEVGQVQSQKQNLDPDMVFWAKVSIYNHGKHDWGVYRDDNKAIGNNCFQLDNFKSKKEAVEWTKSYVIKHGGRITYRELDE